MSSANARFCFVTSQAKVLGEVFFLDHFEKLFELSAEITARVYKLILGTTF